jgi:hypothetical protein
VIIYVSLAYLREASSSKPVPQDNLVWPIFIYFINITFLLAMAAVSLAELHMLSQLATFLESKATQTTEKTFTNSYSWFKLESIYYWEAVFNL